MRIQSGGGRQEALKYHPTAQPEFNELLGGGILPGQVILIGGEPGIGKSTLMLQIAEKLPAVYICGEESPEQIQLRAGRMKVDLTNMVLVDEQEIESILANLNELFEDQKDDGLRLLIVDSIQSLFSSQIKSVAGSIAQVSYCAGKLTEIAKKQQFALIFVGQITKSGYIAGPKMLEHIVDTVFYFEGDTKTDLRILRVAKNRFGPANKLELYQMTSLGLSNAKEYLLNLIESRKGKQAGSILSITLQGNKPIIFEIQALNTPSSYGNARRVTNGISKNRLQMLLAVLERRVGIRSQTQDIYINLSGGLRLIDPGLDLPIAIAIASIIKNKEIPHDMVAVGEVGLLGEIKPVAYHDRVIAEVRKMGYEKIVDYQYASDLQHCIVKLFKDQ